MGFSGITSGFRRVVGLTGLALVGVFAFGHDGYAATVTVERTGNLSVIRGVVHDAGGNPIADASVGIFRNGTVKLLKQVSSARDGSFIARIVPGTYTVLAVAQGFNPVTLFGVEVARSAELVYGFKLERSGAGNTLSEKRLDRNSSKWRIRAAQMQRAIYQNRAGKSPTIAETAEDDTRDTEETQKRKGQSVIETYFAGTDRGNYAGLNFATLMPFGERTEVVLAGQTGIGRNPLHRFETTVTTRPFDDHTFRLSAAGSKLAGFAVGKDERPLGQLSFQATDEWKVREGIILVYGLDYSRFVGASNDTSITPRLGLQLDLNSRTRFRSAYTAQTEERSWTRAIELEGQTVSFVEPVAIEDLAVADGKPQLNKSRRLEFGIERLLSDRSSVEANVFFDTTLGRGVGLNSFAFDSLDPDGLGDSVANQQGNARGIRVVYTRRISGLLSTSAGYSFGNGQKLSAGVYTDPASLFENDFFQTFFAQVATDLRTGTSIRTVYRLSPQATVFAIDPFRGRLAIYDPGLSVFVTQTLPTLGLPLRAQAVIDARNLFDLQSGIFGDEGGIRLNNARRMIIGGIQVRF